MPADVNPPLSLDAPVLQALLDIMPGTLHVKDRELRYQAVNRYYAEHWGMRTEDFVGKRATELFGDEYDAAVEARDRKVLESGQPLPFYEVEYPTGTGGRIALWATKMPLFDEQGRPSHILTLALDITPLKRAERALNESELIRAATVQRALDSIIVTDQEGVVIEFNPAAEQIFGHRRQDVLGRRVDEVIIPGPHRQAHVDAMQRFAPGNLAGRGGRRFETEALRADGTIFPVEIAVAEIPLAGRSLFTAHVRDLSERKAVEAELDRQRQALHQSSKLSAMGKLMASISHELKNPLSVVIGQSLLLCESATDEHVRRRAQRISDAAERCASIVNNFLDMARQRPPVMVEVDLGAVIDASLDLTGDLLRARDIRIQVRRDGDLPKVPGDPHQIGQVLMNLIVNAEQAMQETPPPRRLRIATAHDAAAGRVTLEVADTGPGFTEETAGKLFTPFFTTRSSAEGTGLGLAICRDIIAAHGGTITAENRRGGGALFRIVLPVTAPAGHPRGPRAAAAAAGAEGARVLVVDDDAEVRATLGEMLALGGYRVEAAASAEHALELVASRDFDAVLSDVRMPGMSGIELRERLVRSHPALAGRFAFITGEASSLAEGALPRDQGVRMLEKPVTPRDVLDLVASLLR